ncbi:hypothetical protein ACNHYB_14620 [Isoptericola jiangsuensis]|uniref:hypothetical protein n=1 Tax=Isoptericola jiangsuensis TaxID=548579 RepID=UPI003AAE4A28
MSMMRTDADVELADYGEIIRRRWVFLVLGLVVGLCVAAIAAELIPKTYTSTASVLVQSTGEDASVEGGRTSGDLNLDTEAQLVTSTVVSSLAMESMDDPIETDPRLLARHVMVTVPANTSVLDISFSAGTAADAQAGASAFADAYLTNRLAGAESRRTANSEAIESQVAALQEELKKQTTLIDKLPADSDEREFETSQRDLLVSQIATLNGQLISLAATDLQAGKIITEAQLPTEPSSPNVTILAVSGLLGGLLAGLLAAVLVDRADRRVRGRRDLDRVGLETLAAAVDLPNPELSWLGAGTNPDSLHQVRNALLARMHRDRSVLVAGMSADSTGSALALHLAATFARSGVETLLVSANSSAFAVSDVFDRGDSASLSDVLLGKADEVDAIFEVPDVPHLRAVAASADGRIYSELLQSGRARSVITALAEHAEVTVVDVAPTSVNADAQSLATLGPGVLLVATSRRTTRPEAADALDQLRHVSATVLGSVVANMHSRRDDVRHGRAPEGRSRPPHRATGPAHQRPSSGASADDADEPGETPGGTSDKTDPSDRDSDLLGTAKTT